MKKLISCVVLLAMLMSLVTVGVSAAKSTSPDANKVMNIAYGTAKVDGKLDEAYKKSDKIVSWVHNTYDPIKGQPEKVTSSFYTYVLYDDNKIYVFAEVTDPTPVTASKVKSFDYKTDCIEFYWYLHDLSKGGDVKHYSNKEDKGAGLFRTHTKEVCPADDDLTNHFASLTSGTTNGMNQSIINGEIKTEVHRETTKTGYIIEYSFEIHPTLKSEVTAGKTIGFGVQSADDMDDNNTRDAYLFSNNNDGDNTKCGPFLLLPKEAATTKAPAATQKPTGSTTAPQTFDAGIIVAAVAAVSAAGVVVSKKRK